MLVKWIEKPRQFEVDHHQVLRLIIAGDFANNDTYLAINYKSI